MEIELLFITLAASILKSNIVLKMSLTQKALSGINNRTARLKLALALNVSEQTANRLIKNNSDDLTKAAALKVIREETGLSDNEILEELCSQENGEAA